MSDENKIKIYGELKSGVLNGYLTELSQIKDFDKLISNAHYSEETGKIVFENTQGQVVASIDAAPFIKDGMVNKVEVVGSNLVISFNIPGAAPINVPLVDIFQPGNYFTKEEIENRILVRKFNGFVDQEVAVKSVQGSAYSEIYFSTKSNQFCYGRESAINWDIAGQYMTLDETGMPNFPLSGVLFYNMADGKTYFYDGATLTPVNRQDEEVSELMNEVFPLTIQVTREGAAMLEYTGKGSQVNFNVNTSRKGKPVTAESLVYLEDDEELQSITPDSSSVSHQLQVSKLGITKFSARATYQGMIKSASASVELVLPIFVGFGDSEATLASIEGDLTKYVGKSLANVSSLENTEAGSHLIIAVPKNRRLTYISSKGFGVPMSMKEDVRIINEESHNYNFYYSSFAIEAGTMEDLIITMA